MRVLFRDLIWPAAAGNVAWAFLTVILSEPLTDDRVWARLAALLLLAVYLAGEQLRSRNLLGTSAAYCVADAFHVAMIVVFAIAAQLNKDWLEIPLLAVFVVTALGHVAGAWEEPGAANWPRRWALAGSNMLGLAVLYGSHCLFSNPFPWNLPVAGAAVLVAWFLTLRKFA